MKVMISYPPLPNSKGCPMLGQNRQFQWFHNPSFIYPMVPASAATLLDHNDFDVVWNDAIAEEWEYEKFLDYFRSESPDIIALETKTPVVRQHWRIINELKDISPDTKVVLMGDHVTAFPKESFDESKVDYVITGGDYDFSLLSISQNLRDDKSLVGGIYYKEGDGVKYSGSGHQGYDLDKLPFIDRELTKWELYGEKFYKRTPFTYTMVGRDCWWGKCTFCSWTTIHPTFKTRSPESLLDEIGILIEKYKVREVFDDTGTFPSGKWLDTFCKGMIERGYNEKILFDINFRFDAIERERVALMKKAGFRLMKLGLESANQQTLDRLRKGSDVTKVPEKCRIARDSGLEVHLTVMVGYPWETREDAQRTLDLAKMLMTGGYADMLQATITVPYPGTPLYKEAVENNWFRFDPKEYERYDMTEAVFKTPDMEPEEVMKMCNGIYRTFLTPEYMARHLAKIGSVEDIIYTARGFKAVVGHIRDFLKQRNRDGRDGN